MNVFITQDHKVAQTKIVLSGLAEQKTRIKLLKTASPKSKLEEVEVVKPTAEAEVVV